MGFCDPGPGCGNAAFPDDPCKVSEYFYKAAKECGFMACTEVLKNALMPVYEGVPLSEQSVELQSTEAYKGCLGAVSGEDDNFSQIIKMNNCLYVDTCLGLGGK